MKIHFKSPVFVVKQGKYQRNTGKLSLSKNISVLRPVARSYSRPRSYRVLLRPAGADDKPGYFFTWPKPKHVLSIQLRVNSANGSNEFN